MVAGLKIRVYQLVGMPAYTFMTAQGEAFDRDMIFGLTNSDHFQVQLYPGGSESDYAMWVKIGGTELVATEVIPVGDPENTFISVTRNKTEIYRITGHRPDITALHGFWTYDNHWVLESGFIKNHEAPIIGELVEDGVLLNDKNGYQEAFGFQTIHGRPFYFFKKDDVVNAWYDGQEIQLGFEAIPHYGCCNLVDLSPVVRKDWVAFFGIRDGMWYFVQIGTPASFVQ
jgi:hypothetical protein